MTAQLPVGPHSSSSLIRSDSEFTTGKITFGNVDGIAIDILSGATNSITSSGGAVFTSLEVATGITATNIYLSDPDINTMTIGNPTFSTDQTYPDLGTTEYTTTIGMGLTSGLVIPDALNKIENWLDVFLIDTAPAPVLGTTSTTSERVSITWTNPVQYQTGFSDISLPYINEVQIDYVLTSLNGDDSFSDGSTVTISTGLPTIEQFDILLDGTTSGATSSNTVWEESTNWLSDTDYDVQIRLVNHNSERSEKPLILKNVRSQLIGPPDPPTSLTGDTIDEQSLGVTWDPPVDHNTFVVGDDSLPYIDYYGITYTQVGSDRLDNTSYGVPAIPTDTGVTYTDPVTNDNSNPYFDLQGLYPGTTYELTVFAKNTRNEDFSTDSNTISLRTDYPDQPTKLGAGVTFGFPDAVFSPFTAGGYDLAGVTAYNYIVNYNNIDGTLDTQDYQTDNSPWLLSSKVVADTGTGTPLFTVSNITAYAGIQGTTLDSVNVDINGFGTANVTGNFPATDFDLNIADNADAYSSSDDSYKGFWRRFICNFNLDSSVFVPSDDVYELYLEQEFLNDSEVVQGDSLIFAVDNLNVDPVLSEVGITGIQDNDSNMISYFSGVPSYNSDVAFTYRANIAEIASNYLRNDLKHLDVFLADSGSNVISDINTVSQTDIGITHQYYSKPVATYEISTTLHNTDGLVLAATSSGSPREDIQFNDFTVGLNITEGLYTEEIILGMTGYNLYGSDYVESGYVDSLGGTQSLRIDLNSYNADLSSADYTTSDYGQHVNSGITTYASVPDTDFGITYDHTQDISDGSGTYELELQLVNGKFCSVSHTDAFKDYTNHFFPPDLSIPVYDYSDESTSGTRYVTFKYQKSFSDKKNKVKITLINADGFTTDFTQDDGSNHELYLRVYDPRTLSPGDYTFDTAWLNCGNATGIMGVTNVVNGSGCLITANSTTDVRYCLIKPATQDAIFYVKVGIPNNSTLSIENVQLEMV